MDPLVGGTLLFVTAWIPSIASIILSKTSQLKVTKSMIGLLFTTSAVSSIFLIAWGTARSKRFKKDAIYPSSRNISLTRMPVSQSAIAAVGTSSLWVIRTASGTEFAVTRASSTRPFISASTREHTESEAAPRPRSPASFIESINEPEQTKISRRKRTQVLERRAALQGLQGTTGRDCIFCHLKTGKRALAVPALHDEPEEVRQHGSGVFPMYCCRNVAHTYCLTKSRYEQSRKDLLELVGKLWTVRDYVEGGHFGRQTTTGVMADYTKTTSNMYKEVRRLKGSS